MYEELIHRLENAAGGPEGIRMAHDAAAAIAALQSENVEKDKEIERLEKCRHECKIDCLLEEYNRVCKKLVCMEAERDALLEYANARMECEMCKNDIFCPMANQMAENCALCELKPKCPCHPCKWEWRGVQGEG